MCRVSGREMASGRHRVDSKYLENSKEIGLFRFILFAFDIVQDQL